MGIVITTLAVAGISSLTALGILALPWSEAELSETTKALAAVPEVMTKLAAPLGGGAASTVRGPQQAG